MRFEEEFETMVMEQELVELRQAMYEEHLKLMEIEFGQVEIKNPEK